MLLLRASLIRFEYAYMPPLSKVANPQRIKADIAYDLWGRAITDAEAEQLAQSEHGRAMLTPANGPRMAIRGRSLFSIALKTRTSLHLMLMFQ